MLAYEPACLRLIRLFALDQATFWRRRRANAKRPAQATSNPGNPAPTNGAGTAAWPDDIVFLALLVVPARALMVVPKLFIVKSRPKP